MKRLRATISFLSILPVGKITLFEPVKLIPLFPVVGLIIGGLLVLFDAGVSLFWPYSVTAVLDVIFLAVITGALHLDGLGDAADGLFSHRSRERVLEIMKDSRVGAMGLVTVVCALGAKGVGLAAMEEHRFLALLIIPAYARAGALFGMRYLPYGRPEGGTGTDFFASPLPPSSFIWLLVPMALSVFLGVKGLLLNGVFFSVTFILIFFYKRMLGCITGDMLGAMVEITETTLFLAMAVTLRF